MGYFLLYLLYYKTIMPISILSLVYKESAKIQQILRRDVAPTPYDAGDADRQ
jgi:hypothetical protein